MPKQRVRRGARGAKTVTVRIIPRKPPPYFWFRAICCACGTEVHSEGGPSLWCEACLKGDKRYKVKEGEKR